jgi:phosphoribosylformimino-5-aminoimidazole carboxamide ribotide isomerase
MNPQPSECRVRVIPVIDVMDGQVVRAVGGRRELYQPLTSRVVDSTDPGTVALAMLRTVGVNELYVADLDGLMGHRPRLGWLKGVTDAGVRVMIDSGVRHPEDARHVFEAGATSVIAATETLGGFGELKALCEAAGHDRIIFSVDLRNGKVVGAESAWGVGPDPVELVRQAVASGIQRVVLLELARVGTGIGPGTVGLCQRTRAVFPDLELVAGGGVRNHDDVNRLADAGADGVLVASAIHDGQLHAPHNS